MTALEYFKGDDLAANVWQSKYAMEGEQTPDDMHKRLAKEFYRIDQQYQQEEIGWFAKNRLSDYALSREPLSEESIFNLFKNFKYIVPQGSIMFGLGRDALSTLSNCYYIGRPYDSYGGILQKDEELVQLMKRRAGVGIDISSLRPNGTFVSNAAKSSTGAASFMERFSNSTREVAQDGRRGALMITIDIRHPDVEEFINKKQDRTKVTGANISVMLRDDFMKAVLRNEDYILRWPVNSEVPDRLYDTSTLEYNVLTKVESYPVTYLKRVKAKDIYDQIVSNAWDNAEPGQLFIDRIQTYCPDGVYPEYKPEGVNPCAEITMPEGDSCRLMVVNFFSFVVNPFTERAWVDFKSLYEVCYEQQRLMDNVIDLEAEHITNIIHKIELSSEPLETKRVELAMWKKNLEIAISGRRTGSGFTGLGDTLAALGLAYDSDSSLEVINSLLRTKLRAELDCTIDLAVLRGCFKGWDWTKEFADNNGVLSGKNPFYEMLLSEFPEHCNRMINCGRRNVSWSTVAPTGSVSILTQTSSGIEPLFSPYYTRRKKINPSDKESRVDFVDQNGDSWQEYAVLHPKFKEWLYTKYESLSMEISVLEEAFKASPWYNSTANDIDWIKRISIQSIIQKYTTHSISSTINLPNSVSKEVVAEIYLKGWTEGLKGVTLYRDGCRTGVLVKNKTSFEYKDSPKRPKELPCSVDTVKVKGQSFTVLVGLLEDKPYELFAIPHEVMKGYSSGILVKKGKGKYNLICNLDEEINITSGMTEEQETITRLISAGLRHGTNVKFICEQLLKTEGELNSFTKAIARVLKKHIPDGEKSTVTCNECKSSDVVFQEGCLRCNNCGNSKCG